MNNINTRTYKKESCIAFLRTKESYGGLSNMASGYPITINGTKILTSEALYQAIKFPFHPEIQKEIIEQRSPINAKKVSRKYENYIREDWYSIRVKVMEWVVYAKLLNNWFEFGELLESTKGYDIVEISFKDNFWGVYPQNEKYIGINALGRILMSIREKYLSIKSESRIKIETCKGVPNFILLNEFIETIKLDKNKYNSYVNMKLW